MTHFERLGLPAGFAVEPAELERAFLTASKASHPDHHAGGQDDTAAVNAAYHTLRDPVRRAEYLLELTPAASSVPTLPPDPSFLMEMMNVRERAEGGDRAVAGELSDRLADLTAALARQFAAADYAGVRRTLAATKTVRSLLREVTAGD